jgi:FMN-dependent NADH-azoreductase
MPRILIVMASARGLSSASAKLALDFAASRKSDGFFSELCILADNPPPPLNAAFVEAAFAPPTERTDEMRAALFYSDDQISRLRKADILVFATPMYNFGIPGLLKSWFDQIIRPGETFTTTGDRDVPYRGLLTTKECVIISTRGSYALSPAGVAAEYNFLDPHLAAMLGLIGVDNIRSFDCAGLDESATGADAILALTRNAIMAS